ncbi:Integral membrane protein, putative [Trichomonas vaginalis G3]|uniref:Integral membrane protein, putative n=1 Tax=Trichomonas vaginalis (strain ATCC PRA-98 / G3) TaxID=412133 RepID=A2DIR9_TRIV3|nr:membrane protein-related family [Trichomonas vaginalis G3]EAY19682.1 Integral membrane protein, putative [Trichomonas vaginalis G3]KAI5521298.1 membrane protein-related family [Trichomonas vaginalis G3]|eukprot:XP_001580668.1 Integral membrane protein [Trichomonas vaginalis G3]
MGSHAFAVTGMLILGTATSVCMKIMLGLDAPGYMGIVHNFDKPFMQSIQMFFGMAFAVFINKCWDPENKGPRPKSSIRQKVMASVPSAFDLFASTLMTFGLIYINVSVFQMLRGSMVIFSAILSIIFLKRHIHGYEWFAITTTIIALVMIGVAGVFIPSSESSSAPPVSAGQKVLGCFLVILSQLVQAGQIVTEEFILRDINMPALEIVGWEGIWGLLMMVVIACPFAYICPGQDPSPLGKSLENIFDSFQQLFNSGSIALVSLIFVIAVMLYNIFGMLVTSGSSAIFRTILEAARTLLIWIFMLIAYKANWGFGEVWCNWSWLELAGFAILIVSTLMYNAIIKLPFFTYPSKEQPLLADKKNEA